MDRHEIPDARGLLERLATLAPQWILGCEEPFQQLGLASALLRANQGETLIRAAAGLGLWSWQSHPLSGKHADLAALSLQSAGDLSRAPAGMVDHLRQKLLLDLDASSFDELARSGEHGLLLRHGLPLLRDERQGLFWLSRAFEPMLAAGSREHLAAAVDAVLDRTSADPAEQSLRARLLAEAAFCLDPPDAALERLDAVDPRVWGWWRKQRTAELLARTGRLKEAADLYAELHRAMPWHVNILLRLDGLLQAPGQPPKPDLSSTAVLLYSWNKAGLLRDTLTCLAGTEAAQAGLVAVLDNGSTDDTAAVLKEAARGPLGPALKVVRPRVNVGAPAARNWLLSLDETRAMSRLVFLDDDVVVEPGFLHALVAAAEAHPQFGTVGCRIKAARPPGFMQSADYNLLPPRPGAGPAGSDMYVHVFDNCAGKPDTGLFTYTRPAAHVSGCCHLLRRDTLDTVGGFDIRFSPTQFDDLDRDLRLLASGSACLYAGEVEVRHVQYSSLAKAQTLAQTGQVLGNMVKLAAKYGEAEAVRMHQSNMSLIADHCLAATGRVRAAL